MIVGRWIAKVLSDSLTIRTHFSPSLPPSLSPHPWLYILPKLTDASSPILRAGSGAALDDLPATQITRVGGLGTPDHEEMESHMATPRAMAFRLCSRFVNSEGRANKPRFGFNGLGELVYQRTYARYLGEDTNEKEQWCEYPDRNQHT